MEPQMIMKFYETSCIFLNKFLIERRQKLAHREWYRSALWGRGVPRAWGPLRRSLTKGHNLQHHNMLESNPWRFKSCLTTSTTHESVDGWLINMAWVLLLNTGSQFWIPTVRCIYVHRYKVPPPIQFFKPSEATPINGLVNGYNWCFNNPTSRGCNSIYNWIRGM